LSVLLLRLLQLVHELLAVHVAGLDGRQALAALVVQALEEDVLVDLHDVELVVVGLGQLLGQEVQVGGDHDGAQQLRVLLHLDELGVVHLLRDDLEDLVAVGPLRGVHLQQQRHDLHQLLRVLRVDPGVHTVFKKD